MRAAARLSRCVRPRADDAQAVRGGGVEGAGGRGVLQNLHASVCAVPVLYLQRVLDAKRLGKGGGTLLLLLLVLRAGKA